MDQLYRLKDTLVDYLSPNKRRRTIGPITPSHRISEQPLYEPTSEPQDKRTQATLRKNINEKYLSPSDTKFGLASRKRPREDDSVSPEESASQITLNDERSGDEITDVAAEEAEGSELSLEDDVEIEVSPEDKVEEYLARQAELALKKDAIEKAKAEGGWHPEELYLFERLSMRSFEELLPTAWQIDFPTLPEDLFTDVQDKTFVNFNCGSSYRGVRALKSLLSLGGRVKDKIEADRHCEGLIVKEIRNYIKWSEMDGGFDKLRFIPILTIVGARPNQPVTSITKSLTDQMEFLAKKHREHLSLPQPQTDELGEAELYSRRPPMLYGILVARTFTLFVTLDSSNPEAKLRSIAHFDFKEKDVDVWNGFALAIIVIVARNYMMSIKDELEVDDGDSSSDPDA